MQLDFTKDYCLEDDRVMLRPLRPDDFEHLRHFAILEPEIWIYSMVPANSESAMRHYIDTAMQAREALREYPFIVFDKANSQYAGSTRLYDIQLAQKTTHLGYTWYGKEYQGSGLNKHCKFLLLQFAFEQIDMLRVEFRADNENKRSIAAMKSIGCTVEGLLRSSSFKQDGSRRDSIVLSILQSEWENTIKTMLQRKLAPGA